jgi:VIT1/CCC1 family predicted Fe2+/Mn2+ transporter
MGVPTSTAAPPRDSAVGRLIRRAGFKDEHDFILRVVQPALVGLIDGTVSSLAPIFAAALASSSHTALLVGFSTALGAGVSMGWSEALSDTGEQTGRGSAIVRGAITGGMTALGGLFHTLPFIISDVHKALIVAGAVVAIELFVIAWIRNRFLEVSMRSSLLVVTVGGVIVLAIGVAIGSS